MRTLLLLTILMTLGGCATKYMVPSNRFLTPETQGGAFRGQFELQHTQAHQLTLMTDNSRVDEGVTYKTIPRTGYSLSSSVFDAIDFVWSHVAGANSLAGAKVQFLGASRTAKGAGHKLGAVVLFGGNEHETDDEAVKFRLDGTELMLMYGYRLSENILPYASLGRSSYKFAGSISSPNPLLNGQEPNLETSVNSLNGGVELSWEAFLGKFECSYQQIKTSDTKEKTALSYGLSFGLSW